MKIRGFLVILMLAAIIVFFLYTMKSGGEKDIPEQIEAFSRAKEKNRVKIAEAEKAGRLRVLMKSNVKHIEADQVVIKTGEEE